MPITVNSTVKTSPCLPEGIVARRAMDRPHCAVRERLGVELRGIQGGAVVPEANRVLAGHLGSPELERYVYSTLAFYPLSNKGLHQKTDNKAR